MKNLFSHAIAQAFDHQFPIAVAWIQSQVRSCRIYGKQSGKGMGVLSYNYDNTQKLKLFTIFLWHTGLPLCENWITVGKQLCLVKSAGKQKQKFWLPTDVTTGSKSL
jgi:hypothetical protein